MGNDKMPPRQPPMGSHFDYDGHPRLPQNNSGIPTTLYPTETLVVVVLKASELGQVRKRIFAKYSTRWIETHLPVRTQNMLTKSYDLQGPYKIPASIAEEIRKERKHLSTITEVERLKDRVNKLEKAEAVLEMYKDTIREVTPATPTDPTAELVKGTLLDPNLTMEQEAERHEALIQRHKEEVSKIRTKAVVGLMEKITFVTGSTPDVDMICPTGEERKFTYLGLHWKWNTYPEGVRLFVLTGIRKFLWVFTLKIYKQVNSPLDVAHLFNRPATG